MARDDMGVVVGDDAPEKDGEFTEPLVGVSVGRCCGGGRDEGGEG